MYIRAGRVAVGGKCPVAWCQISISLQIAVIWPGLTSVRPDVLSAAASLIMTEREGFIPEPVNCPGIGRTRGWVRVPGLGQDELAAGSVEAASVI